MKARGPKVDKIPPLRLDLDFMDTSGYVVLPVESPALPVDAMPDKGSVRPFEKLQITQTLDERQAAEGKLILEVKATARGLVPDLENIVKLDHAGFQIDKIDDQGISVSRFDPDSDANLIDSDAHLACCLSRGPGSGETPHDVSVRQNGRRRSRTGLSALRGRGPGQGRPGDLARGHLRPAAVCLARVGRREPPGTVGCGGRDMENSFRAQACGAKAVSDARASHAIFRARPLTRDPVQKRLFYTSNARTCELNRAHRALLFHRIRRRFDRPAPGRGDLDTPRKLRQIDACLWALGFSSCRVNDPW